MKKSAIMKGIASLKGRTNTITKNIQTLGVAVIQHRGEHGDCTLATKLYNAVSSGVRKEALKAWLRAFGAMKFDTKANQFKTIKTKEVDVAGAKANQWNEFTRETTVSDWTIEKKLAQLKRLTTDVNKHASVADKAVFQAACHDIGETGTVAPVLNGMEATKDGLRPVAAA